MTEFGQRHAAFLPPLPRLRLAAAALVLGAALAGAVILHGHRVRCPPRGITCLIAVARRVRAGWVDPLAIGICLFGLAAAAAVLVRPLRRFVAATLILTATVGGAVALSGHRVFVYSRAAVHPTSPQSIPADYACPGPACYYHPRPAWVEPSMAGLVVLGLTGAAGILIATRRRRT
jgi:hypothetical protein